MPFTPSMRLVFPIALCTLLISVGAARTLSAPVSFGGQEEAGRHCSSSTQCFSVTNTGTGNAISGTSAVRVGIVGITNNPSASDKYGTTGVQGISANSNGVEGITNNPSLSTQFGRAAVFGIDASNDGGQKNWGTAGYSKNGSGILGLSFASPQASGAPFSSALLAVCGNGGSSIEAADGPLVGANLFLLADCAGNITLEGTVTTGTPPMISTKNVAGTRVAAYAARESEPTIEDFGSAQLTNGRATVSLHGDFAATITRDGRYLVTITPEGDSRGLYVTAKTLQSFDVRESQGGRSSIAFTYRIVAKPLGDAEARLPAVRNVLGRRGAVPNRAGARNGIERIGSTRNVP